MQVADEINSESIFLVFKALIKKGPVLLNVFAPSTVAEHLHEKHSRGY